MVTSTKNKTLVACSFAIYALFATTVTAQEPTPGYNNKIPESILSPDEVETRIGTLEFFDGIPDEDSAALLFDNLDLNRGIDQGQPVRLEN